MSSIKIKRGTRAQLSTAAAANGLKQGELYHVTDEDRVDLGTAVGASVALAKKSEVDGKAAASHAHTISDVSGLDAALAGKASTGHGHAISDVSGLQTVLDAKAPLVLPTLTGLREVMVTVAASNIDLATGNLFTKTISGATTLTVSNVPASGTLASFILDMTNGGSATITWWSGVKWAGGTAPTLTAAGRDVLGFYTHDGGTAWTGLLLGKDVK